VAELHGGGLQASRMADVLADAIAGEGR